MPFKEGAPQKLQLIENNFEESDGYSSDVPDLVDSGNQSGTDGIDDEIPSNERQAKDDQQAASSAEKDGEEGHFDLSIQARVVAPAAIDPGSDEMRQDPPVDPSTNMSEDQFTNEDEMQAQLAHRQLQETIRDGKTSWNRKITHPCHYPTKHEFSDEFRPAGKFGWKCAGIKMAGGCRSGFDAACDDSFMRYRCLECNFDLCALCFMDPTLTSKNHRQGEGGEENGEEYQIILNQKKKRVPRPKGPGKMSKKYFDKIKAEAERSRAKKEEFIRQLMARPAPKPKRVDPEYFEKSIERLTAQKPKKKVPISSLMDDVTNCTFQPKLSKSVVENFEGVPFEERVQKYIEKFEEKKKSSPPRDPNCTFQPKLEAKSLAIARAAGGGSVYERMKHHERVKQERIEAREKAIQKARHGNLPSSQRTQAIHNFMTRLSEDAEKRERSEKQLESERNTQKYSFKPKLNTEHYKTASQKSFIERMFEDEVRREIRIDILRERIHKKFKQTKPRTNYRAPRKRSGKEDHTQKGSEGADSVRLRDAQKEKQAQRSTPKSLSSTQKAARQQNDPNEQTHGMSRSHSGEGRKDSKKARVPQLSRERRSSAPALALVGQDSGPMRSGQHFAYLERQHAPDSSVQDSGAAPDPYKDVDYWSDGEGSEHYAQDSGDLSSDDSSGALSRRDFDREREEARARARSKYAQDFYSLSSLRLGDGPSQAWEMESEANMYPYRYFQPQAF